MPTIKIDDKEYDSDKLPDEARAQLLSLQFVDAEIQRLNAQVAVFQTARATYGRALSQLLAETYKKPAVAGGDTLKLT